jgi:hypothetical protein
MMNISDIKLNSIWANKYQSRNNLHVIVIEICESKISNIKPETVTMIKYKFMNDSGEITSTTIHYFLSCYQYVQ